MKDPKNSAYKTRVYQQMLGDLTYPVAKDGSVMDASAVKPWICWHLVRCGWRKPNNTDNFPLVEEYDDPVIKPRRVFGPGVIDDALTWVPFTDPDDPLAGLANMTMGQIEALPEDVRFEAKRRLGIIPSAPEPDPDAGWRVSPHINITDEADVNDGTQWT